MLESDEVPPEVYAFIDTLIPPPYNGGLSVGNWSECVTFEYFLGSILNTAVVYLPDDKCVVLHYMWVPTYAAKGNCLLYVVSPPEYRRAATNPTYMLDILQTQAPVLYSSDWCYDSEQRCLVSHHWPNTEQTSYMTWEECVKSNISFK